MNEEQITPEQKEQLSNWSIQRDTLLNEIANLTNEKETLSKANTEIALSSIDISNRIEQSKGRMEELDRQEADYINIISVEIPGLESQKTKLETEIPNLKEEIGVLSGKKDALTKDISFLIKIQEEVFNRTGILEKVVENVTNVSSANVKELDNAVISITEKVKEILVLSDTNLKAHTEILNEIPKLFVELQRQTLTRQKI